MAITSTLHYNEEATKAMIEEIESVVFSPSENGRHRLDHIDEYLKAGADPNACDSEGTPALICLQQIYHYPALRMLLEAGADPNAPDADGRTILFHAEQAADIERVYTFARTLPDALVTDVAGNTPHKHLYKKAEDYEDQFHFASMALEEAELAMAGAQWIAKSEKEGTLSLTAWCDAVRSRFMKDSNYFKAAQTVASRGLPFAKMTRLVFQRCEEAGTPITVDELLSETNLQVLMPVVMGAHTVLDDMYQLAESKGVPMDAQMLEQTGMLDFLRQRNSEATLLQPYWRKKPWPELRDFIADLPEDFQRALLKEGPVQLVVAVAQKHVMERKDEYTPGTLANELSAMPEPVRESLTGIHQLRATIQQRTLATQKGRG